MLHGHITWAYYMGNWAYYMGILHGRITWAYYMGVLHGRITWTYYMGVLIIIIEGLSLLQSIPPTTANKQTQAQKKGGAGLESC